MRTDENQKDQLPITAVIARRAKPDAAIRILCGAKHRPVPPGPEENGLPRRFAPRNDVEIW